MVAVHISASVQQPRGMHNVPTLTLLHLPAILQRMMIGEVLMVHPCSFMYTNHIDEIVHTQPFYELGNTLVIQTSIMQAADGVQLPGHGQIPTHNHQFGKRVP